MKKLKIVLQSNLTYVLLFLFIVIYIIFFTKIIKPDINISSNESEGIVTDIDINKDKASFILKNKHLIKCNYYFKDYDNIDNFKNLLGKKIKVFGTKKEYITIQFQILLIIKNIYIIIKFIMYIKLII